MREFRIQISEFRINLKSKAVLWVITFIFIVGVLGFLTSASYLGWDPRVVPRGLLDATDVAITHIPLLPKTPKQVMTRTVFEMGRVESGEHHFSLELTENPGEGNEKTIFSPKVFGPFKKSGDQIDLSATVSLGFSEESTQKSKIEFIEESDYFYFKAGDLPPLLGLDFRKLGSDWHKLDLTKITSDAKANVKEDAEIVADIKDKTGLILEILKKDGFRKVQVLPTEAVDGRESFHYQRKLSKEEITKIEQALLGEEASNLLEKISLDLFIDKSNFHFNKLEIKGAVSRDSEEGSDVILNVPDLGFHLVYELKKGSEEVEIKAPEDAKEIGSLLDLYLLVQSERKESPAEQILGATSGLGEFGANFLTVERLLHVLYLTPQAF